jgi:hypothetical protein
MHMALAVAALQATEKYRVTMLAGADAEAVAAARAAAVVAWQVCQHKFPYTRARFLALLETKLVLPEVVSHNVGYFISEVVMDFRAMVTSSVQITLTEYATGEWHVGVFGNGVCLRYPSAHASPDVFSALWKTHQVLTPSQFVILEPYLTACMSPLDAVGPHNLLVPGCPWQWAVHFRMLELLGRVAEGFYMSPQASNAVVLMFKAAVWRAVGRGWVPDTVRPRSTLSLAWIVGSRRRCNFVKVAAGLYLAGLCPQDVMGHLFWNKYQVPCVTLTALTLLLGGFHGPAFRDWGAAWRRVHTWLPWAGDASLFVGTFGRSPCKPPRDAWATAAAASGAPAALSQRPE